MWRACFYRFERQRRYTDAGWRKTNWRLCERTDEARVSYGNLEIAHQASLPEPPRCSRRGCRSQASLTSRSSPRCGWGPTRGVLSHGSALPGLERNRSALLPTTGSSLRAGTGQSRRRVVTSSALVPVNQWALERGITSSALESRCGTWAARACNGSQQQGIAANQVESPPRRSVHAKPKAIEVESGRAALLSPAAPWGSDTGGDDFADARFCFLRRGATSPTEDQQPIRAHFCFFACANNCPHAVRCCGNRARDHQANGSLRDAAARRTGPGSACPKEARAADRRARGRAGLRLCQAGYLGGNESQRTNYQDQRGVYRQANAGSARRQFHASTQDRSRVQPNDLAKWSAAGRRNERQDRKSTRLNSSHVEISYAV